MSLLQGCHLSRTEARHEARAPLARSLIHKSDVASATACPRVQAWLEEGSVEFVRLAHTQLSADLPFILERGGAELRVRSGASHERTAKASSHP